MAIDETTVPAEFRRGDSHPLVETVGELIEQLQRLPSELMVGSGGDVYECIVYNCGQSARDLGLEPCFMLEEYDGDDE